MCVVLFADLLMQPKLPRPREAKINNELARNKNNSISMDTHSISAPPLASSSDVIHALLSANVNDKRHFLRRGGGSRPGLDQAFFVSFCKTNPGSRAASHSTIVFRQSRGRSDYCNKTLPSEIKGIISLDPGGTLSRSAKHRM